MLCQRLHERAPEKNESRDGSRMDPMDWVRAKLERLSEEAGSCVHRFAGCLRPHTVVVSSLLGTGPNNWFSVLGQLGQQKGLDTIQPLTAA
jgi:hypothetical protein